MQRAAAFYAIPAVRFAITGVVHTTMLGLNCTLVIQFHNHVSADNPRVYDSTKTITDLADLAWLLAGGLIMLSELDKYLMKDKFRWDPRSVAVKDEFTQLTKLSNLMTLASLFLRIVRESAPAGEFRNGVNHSFMVIVALNSIFM